MSAPGVRGKRRWASHPDDAPAPREKRPGLTPRDDPPPREQRLGLTFLVSSMRSFTAAGPEFDPIVDSLLDVHETAKRLVDALREARQ